MSLLSHHVTWKVAWTKQCDGLPINSSAARCESSSKCDNLIFNWFYPRVGKEYIALAFAKCMYSLVDYFCGSCLH